MSVAGDVADGRGKSIAKLAGSGPGGDGLSFDGRDCLADRKVHYTIAVEVGQGNAQRGIPAGYGDGGAIAFEDENRRSAGPSNDETIFSIRGSEDGGMADPGRAMRRTRLPRGADGHGPAGNDRAVWPKREQKRQRVGLGVHRRDLDMRW